MGPLNKNKNLTLKQLTDKLTQIEKALKNKNTTTERWHELMVEKSEIEREMLKRF